MCMVFHLSLWSSNYIHTLFCGGKPCVSNKEIMSSLESLNMMISEKPFWNAAYERIKISCTK